MILLLLTLPLVLGCEGRNMFVNLGLSLGTSALFYSASFLVNYLGNSNVISPELAAWVPIMAFGTLAGHPPRRESQSLGGTTDSGPAAPDALASASGGPPAAAPPPAGS